MLEGDALAQRWSGVESNVSKRQIWAPNPASLEAVRAYPNVRGTPAAPPDGKYAGGTLRGIRVLGAFLGDDEWRKTELVARVERALKPLEGILKLRDTKEIHTAQQVMQVLLRFCSNTTLTFFLRAMPPSVTLPAAERHDELIDAALLYTSSSAGRGSAPPASVGSGRAGRRACPSRWAAWATPWTSASRRGLAHGPSSPGRCAICMLLSATLT